MSIPYKTLYTPVERYHRMMAHDANSAEADTLLRCLIVFKESFGHSAIVGVSPEDMSEKTRIVAFDTLRARRIVDRPTRNQFTIDPSVRDLFPVTDALRFRQLAYFIHIQSTYIFRWVRNHEADLGEALDWAHRHIPQVGALLASKFRSRLTSDQDVQGLMQDVYLIAQQRDNRALQASILTRWAMKARHEKDWATAHDFYQKAIALYRQIDRQWDLIKLYDTHGRMMLSHEQFSEAQHSFNAGLDIARRHRWQDEEASVLWCLETIARKHNDLETLRGYFPRLCELNSQDAFYFSRLATLAATIGEIDQARHYYALAVAPNARDWDWDRFRSLWAWGRMEYERGNTAAGCAFCRMALSDAQDRTAKLPSLEEEYASWQREFETMQCDKHMP